MVFDFDGVLVGSNAVKRRAYVDVFAARGVPAATVQAALAESSEGDRFAVIARIIDRARAAGQGTWEAGDGREAAGGAGPESVEVARLADAYNEICEMHTSTCPEIGGVSATLPKLAGRHALYVVSDTQQAPLRRVVARRGWAPYFRDVLGRPRTKIENIGYVLERERVTPDDVVVIGDSMRDLAAARHWSCRFIGIDSDGNDFDPAGIVMLPDVSGIEGVLGAAARC